MSRRVLLAAFVTVACVLVVPRPAPTGAAGRTLTAEPADELGNQVVAVSWTGFDPTWGVTIMQCAGTEPASITDDCYEIIRPPAGNDDAGTAVYSGVTNGDGTGRDVIEVRPALQLPELDCSIDNPCSLVAFENDGEPFPEVGLPTTAALAPLHFARSPADCPTVSAFDVVTEGEASAAQALYSWAARRCTGADPLQIDYTESNSIHGRENFLDDQLDVGIASGPATAEAAAASKRAPEYAPIDLTGVVIAFNVPDAITRQPILEMNLTPRLVAMLIGGSQFGGPGEALFTDPEFLAINPGHEWPSATVAPLLRSEVNDDASLVTRWLDEDAAARRFLDGGDPIATVDPEWKDIDYPTSIFEARNPATIGSYLPRAGTLTNARRLFNSQAPGDGLYITPGVNGGLAVLDAVTAAKFRMPIARLRPASDSLEMATDASGFVAPDEAGISAGYDHMLVDDASGTRAADVTAGGAYPLTKIDYAIVPTEGETAAKAGKIATFVEYASGEGQSPEALSAGYVALPDELRAQAAEVAAAVRTGGGDPAPPGNTETPPFNPDFPNDPGALGGDFQDPLGGDLPHGGGQVADGPGDDGPDEPKANGGASGGGGHEAAAGLPISRFTGGDGQVLLPLLMLIGLFALLLGPGLLVWAGRKQRPTGDGPTVGAAS